MSKEGKAKIIAVIGGRNVDESLLKEAEKVGELIAGNKSILVCGGLSGVMEASARGAKAKGGLTIGILPHELEHAAEGVAHHFYRFRPWP